MAFTMIFLEKTRLKKKLTLVHQMFLFFKYIFLKKILENITLLYFPKIMLYSKFLETTFIPLINFKPSPPKKIKTLLLSYDFF